MNVVIVEAEYGIQEFRSMLSTYTCEEEIVVISVSPTADGELHDD